MAWKVEFEQEAEKELSRLDKQHAKRILNYLFERIATPVSPYLKAVLRCYRT